MPGDALPLGGFPIRNTSARAMARFLSARMRRNEKIAVGFANHHFVTSCQTLECRDTIGRGLLLVNDGIGMQIAAKLRFGRGFAENLNGTDFVPRFLSDLRKPSSVYLVGCDAAVVRRAAGLIARLPHCRIAGYCDGFSLWQHEDRVLREINEVRPDILLVGMGNPLQERWIVERWPQLDAKVIFGVGALFEWMTGAKRRAPTWVRLARLEWAYRVALEPRRLLARYTVDGFVFLSLILRPEPPRRGTAS